MKRQVALSAIGKDRPGIVAGLSRVLFEKGCNLEDSSMTRLKGDFAILLLVTLPPSLATDDLRQALDPVARSLDLTLQLRELTAGEQLPGDDSATAPYALVVYGADRPGIVFRVTEAASSHDINITDLRTHVTGTESKPVYSLAMEVEVPSESAAQAFARDLERLKGDLQVAIRFERVESAEL